MSAPQRSAPQQSAPLPTPLPQRIAVFPSYVAHDLTTLNFPRTPGWKNAIISDINNRPVFKIVSKKVSMSQKKYLVDEQGQTLFTIHQRRFSMPTSFYCKKPDGTRFLEVAGKWSCKLSGNESRGSLLK